MGGSGVIDQFLNIFTTYIDSGFGLLGGDVRFLSQTLIALDITLVGLFWALAGEEDVIARLIKKTLTRFDPVSYPHQPLVSYQTYRHLSGWNLLPLVIRAIGAH